PASGPFRPSRHQGGSGPDDTSHMTKFLTTSNRLMKMATRAARCLVATLLIMVSPFAGSLSANAASRAVPARPPRQGADPFPAMGWTQGADLPNGFVVPWDFAYSYLPQTASVVVFGGAPKAVGETWSDQTWIYRNGAWS